MIFRTNVLFYLAFSDVFSHILDVRSTEEISKMMSGLCKRIGIIAFLLGLAILDTNASVGKIYLLLISNSP